ncbi:MAG: MBL fold metallo-hydrolase, partial [Thermoguttaceae bacterium]|nr:MBL fold metallo-hydrolase [Thermoguttaceae bacterium]
MKPLTAERLRQHRVPQGALSLWWLGQAGFLVKSPGGVLAAIDPYLSNSCKAIGDQFGFNMDRLVPPPLDPADLADCAVYAVTHGHGDHIGANGFIKERFQIPIAIHAGDAPLLTDPAANLSAWMGLPIV